MDISKEDQVNEKMRQLSDALRGKTMSANKGLKPYTVAVQPLLEAPVHFVYVRASKPEIASIMAIANVIDREGRADIDDSSDYKCLAIFDGHLMNLVK